MSAATFAVAVMRWMIGDQHVFFVLPGVTPLGASHWFFLLLGGLLGATGAAYNRLTLWLLDLSESSRRYPAVLRAAVIGGVVGLVAFFAPALRRRRRYTDAIDPFRKSPTARGRYRFPGAVSARAVVVCRRDSGRHVRSVTSGWNRFRSAFRRNRASFLPQT